jgi:hypothetical protein
MDIQIVTRGIPASADEWFRAFNIPEDELPGLTDEDKRRARLRHLNDEQYRRHLALRKFAKERELAEAKSLGRETTNLLAELGIEYRLKGVVKRGLESGWHLLIESKGGRVAARVWDVHFGPEILGADNVGDERQNLLTADVLRSPLFQALGREDALRAAS